MAAPPGTLGPTGPPPPKWTPPGVEGPTVDEESGAVPANVLHALNGFGAALGYWLPHGLNRAKAASARLTKVVG